VTEPQGTLVELLSRLGTRASLAAGESLWREGEPGTEVVLIEDGVLQVLHEGPDGHAVELRTLEPGSVLGEIACLDGEARSASVRAATDCTLLRYPGQAFRDLLYQRPDIVEDLLLNQVRLVRNLTRQVSQYHHRTITDGKTGLYNHGFFTERLAMEIRRARETGDRVSVALIDIDHFHEYNTTQLFAGADRTLLEVAGILKAAGRRGDIVARFGGDEFVSLLYGASRGEAKRFADGIRKQIASTEFAGGATQPLGKLTVSGGVATFPKDAHGGAALVTVANQRLLQAKEQGRNRIVAS